MEYSLSQVPSLKARPRPVPHPPFKQGEPFRAEQRGEILEPKTDRGQPRSVLFGMCLLS